MSKQACLMVRAIVADPADRVDFDHWYATEHLPQAVAAFGAQSAWRGWSEIDPSVHFAVYWFASLDAARAITGSPALKGLIAEFDARWGSRVTRSRDIIEAAQRLP